MDADTGLDKTQGLRLWQILIRGEQSSAALCASTYSTLMRLAWRQGLPFRLAHAVESSGLIERMPQSSRAMTKDLLIEAAHLNRRLRWEIDRIASAVRGSDYPVVLLKGGAYEAAGFAFSKTRFATDVDILVPRDALEKAAADLESAGWETEDKDAYDLAYYHEWMHELPPMRHRERKTVIDVHHTLVPPVARITPVPDLFFKDAVACEATSLMRPSLEDMFVHAALHTFYDGEFAAPLRSMLDLRDLYLLGEKQQGDFGGAVLRRADLHGASGPVADALTFLNQNADIGEIDLAFGVRPGRRRPKWIERVLFWAIEKRCFQCSGFARQDPAFARFLLYVRSHWITMPPLMLLKHLARKGMMRLRGDA